MVCTINNYFFISLIIFWYFITLQSLIWIYGWSMSIWPNNGDCIISFWFNFMWINFLIQGWVLNYNIITFNNLFPVNSSTHNAQLQRSLTSIDFIAFSFPFGSLTIISLFPVSYLTDGALVKSGLLSSVTTLLANSL